MNQVEIMLEIINDVKVVKGRTALQKICYFVNKEIDAGFTFIPHYFGPFSSEVSFYIDSLASSNFIEDRVESGTLLNPWESRNGEFITEWKRHNYELTKEAQTFKSSFKPDEKVSSKIKSIIERLDRTTGLDGNKLSLMAKIDFLMDKYSARGISGIREAAKGFGWELNDDVIKDYLKKLDEFKES